MNFKVNSLNVKLDNKEILNDISFSIEKNELVMIVGLNGAGKTTLLKALVGIIKPTNGEVLIGKDNINSINSKKRAQIMCYIPQNMDNPPKYTVNEFVTMGVTPYLGIFDIPKKESQKQVDEALELFNINYIKDKFLDSISGGERQLSYLARSVVQKSEIMILDEPTAYLDFKRQHLFLEELQLFVRKQGKKAIMTVHDPNLALRYSDKVIVINDRKVLNVIDMNKSNYENEFIITLNKIYDNKLRLINCGDSYMVTWK